MSRPVSPVRRAAVRAGIFTVALAVLSLVALLLPHSEPGGGSSMMAPTAAEVAILLATGPFIFAASFAVIWLWFRFREGMAS